MLTLQDGRTYRDCKFVNISFSDLKNLLENPEPITVYHVVCSGIYNVFIDENLVAHELGVETFYQDIVTTSGTRACYP